MFEAPFDCASFEATCREIDAAADCTVDTVADTEPEQLCYRRKCQAPESFLHQ